jgi:hypothetical protein
MYLLCFIPHVVNPILFTLRETLYASTEVSSVIVPGAMGEYEVTADHVPIVAELKAGMMTIKHSDGEDEKYFVPGGFSLTHEGSTTVSLSFCLWLVGLANNKWQKICEPSGGGDLL